MGRPRSKWCVFRPQKLDIKMFAIKFRTRIAFEIARFEIRLVFVTVRMNYGLFNGQHFDIDNGL